MICIEKSFQQFTKLPESDGECVRGEHIQSLDRNACNAYNKDMEYVTLRVRKETQRKLKIVAALAEESMLEALERLVTAELERLQQVKHRDQGTQNTSASH
ncbi:MAG TPA: hypothetical protein VEI53_07950 [Ktedonobacteraceae bacterium]|nr:hypothetical protein [Ktedonobacteraceae bacterium]HYA99121.1 hypothetical protein [Ktedonobacteraceae bacterium]